MPVTYFDEVPERAQFILDQLPRVCGLLKSFIHEPAREYCSLDEAPNAELFLEWLTGWCQNKFEAALIQELATTAQRDLSELELRSWPHDFHHILVDLEQIPEIHPSLRMIWAMGEDIRVWIHWLDQDSVFREWSAPEWVAIGVMKIWMEDLTLGEHLEELGELTGLSMGAIEAGFSRLVSEGAILRRYANVT